MTNLHEVDLDRIEARALANLAACADRGCYCLTPIGVDDIRALIAEVRATRKDAPHARRD